jgi:hypothetical protein
MTLVCVLLLVAATSAPSPIPSGPTPAAELSAPGFAHHELLRIDRDFGKPQWELAVDGWVTSAPPHRVQAMRLWWVNTDEADRRKPLSRTLQRHVAFDFTPRSGNRVDVRLAGDGKEYRFVAERDSQGALAVFADVQLAGGTFVRRCRVSRGRLTARRFLGVPIGVATLGVRCVDREGKEHDAIVPYKEIERGPRYRPDED